MKKVMMAVMMVGLCFGAVAESLPPDAQMIVDSRRAEVTECSERLAALVRVANENKISLDAPKYGEIKLASIYLKRGELDKCRVYLSKAEAKLKKDGLME